MSLFAAALKRTSFRPFYTQVTKVSVLNLRSKAFKADANVAETSARYAYLVDSYVYVRWKGAL